MDEDYYEKLIEEQEKRDAEDNAIRIQWEEQRRQQDEYENQALQETINDTRRENCYADYSGGKGATMECEYNTSPSTYNPEAKEATTLVVATALILAVVMFLIFRPIKR